MSAQNGNNLSLINALHLAAAEHADQGTYNAMVDAGMNAEAFELAFEEGDELFEADFNALDGGGANVGKGQRYTRVPRADLDGPGEWADHFPPRATGPNGTSCISCHNLPFPDGAGGASSNAIRDPLHSGKPKKFINRNTPHMFGSGALQVLAEEMTTDLHAIVAEAVATACATGEDVEKRLKTKGVRYGWVRVRYDDDDDDDYDDDGDDDDDDDDDDDYDNYGGGGSPFFDGGPCNARVMIDARGIDDDLVVRPYQWKGSVPTMRDFNIDALHNELGMQAVEFVGAGIDGDGDGVADEFGVGDVTALTVYLAAQPRPITSLELAMVGLETVTPEQEANIAAGEALFMEIGCDSCHKPSLTVNVPIYSEPSQHPAYQPNPLPAGLDPASAITFDLTTDHFDNIFTLGNGTEVHLGSFETDADGGAIVRLYGDLKRHNMGSKLAESIDEVGTGRANFITKELWGVADTPPYMHDGRATTLTEAILWHGGEGRQEREAFEALSTADQSLVIEFLESLRTLLHE